MKREKKWQVVQEEDWQSVMPDIIEFCGNLNKWKLYGEMGAGKTSFVKALGHYLGFDEVASPTFAIVNDYKIPETHWDMLGEIMHHIDLYRIEDTEELIGIGLEEYLYDPYLTIVEWPGISAQLWPEEFVEFRLEVLEKGKRELLVILHTTHE